MVVFITHDLDEALRLGDQIAILRDGEVIQQGTSQEIVLRPADDYVANFVKEVTRGRVVHVDAVMEPPRVGLSPNGTTIQAGTTIEDALSLIASGPDGDVAVVGHDGRPLGVVNLRQLAGAMVNAPLHNAAYQAQEESKCG